MWVGSRDSKLEIRVWRRSKNVSRKRFNSGKYSDTDDNSALLLHSKSVGNLMVIWYGKAWERKNSGNQIKEKTYIYMYRLFRNIQHTCNKVRSTYDNSVK